MFQESAATLQRFLMDTQAECATSIDCTVYHGDDANAHVARDCTVILLCVKPQLATAVLSGEDVRDGLKGKLVISILAGYRLVQLKELLPETAVIRAMPNT